MLQVSQADGEPWEASTYWEYPSFENRNREIIKLNGKLAGGLLSYVVACDGHGVGAPPHCMHRQRG